MEVKFNRQVNSGCNVLSIYHSHGNNSQNFTTTCSTQYETEIIFFGVELQDLDAILETVVDARERLLKINS